MKKYFITTYNKQGDVIFSGTSDSAKALLKRFNKAAFFSDGNMSAEFYNAKTETNIPEEIRYRVSCGEDL